MPTGSLLDSEVVMVVVEVAVVAVALGEAVAPNEVVTSIRQGEKFSRPCLLTSLIFPVIGYFSKTQAFGDSVRTQRGGQVR